MIEIPDFNKAFQDGAVLPCEERTEVTSVVRCSEIGKLRLTSGQIITSDPIEAWWEKPLSLRIQLGLYPVIVSIADINSRTACVMLRFSEQQPVRWVMAAKEGEDFSTLREDKIFGYGVDSGMGSFMDIEAAKILEQKDAADPDGIIKYLFAETDKNQGRWANILLDDSTGLNAILFGSGYGDGFYPSFWGYAGDGQTTCLVTDFGVLDGTMKL